MTLYSLWRWLFILPLLVVCNNAPAQQGDLRGPILSDQFSVSEAGKGNAPREGIFATGLTYMPPVSGSGPDGNLPSGSHWIWIDPARYPDLQNTAAGWAGHRKEGGAYMVNFKKLANIDGEVASVTLKISADVQYRLFINGRLSSRGPANIGSDYGDDVSPRHWFYDQFDTRHSFKQGMNVIAVEVSTTGLASSATTMGRGGLFLHADIRLRSGKTLSVQTDPSWVCEPSKVYRPDQVTDASRETPGWYTSPTYDKTWSNAVVLPDSIALGWKLRQSELPQMMEKRIFPVRVSQIGPSGDTVFIRYPFMIKAAPTPQKIRLEFDNLYTGYVGLKVNGKAGTRLKLVTEETAGNAAQEMNYILADGAQTYEFPRLSDGKYIDVTITNPDGDLLINELVINYSAFPVNYTGDFSCSDSTLNALWKNIRWITQMNMQTYHMDSPLHQEPVSDAGDYLIESLVNYYTFSSPLLVKQDLRKIGLVMQKTGYQMFHTSYMLLWVQMLLHYYEYTGDKALLKELAPTMFALLDKFHSYIGQDGIITNAPNYMFMDWGSLSGVEFHHPPASLGQGYMTAFYYQALREGGKMAGYLGDGEKSARLSGEAGKLKTAFVNTLYDTQTHLFRNGLAGSTVIKPYQWMPRDTAFVISLPYVNTLAVLYGLAPAGAEKDILQYVLTQKEVMISPYFMYFVLDALAEADVFNRYGTEQLRRWELLSQHPVGLREGWAMGDYSHAWGGSPAYILSAKVLGVTPAKPGFEEVQIAPNPADLTRASGTVSTPRGKVAVHWEHTGKGFFLTANNPATMPVTFIVPLYNGRLITLNGKKVIADQAGKDKIVIRSKGGNNIITIIQ